MKSKKCFKCNKSKYLTEFYKHPQMGDGHLGKCKECAKDDASINNGIHQRRCAECEKEFNTTGGELKRGGGIVCSRKCYYQRLRKIIKTGEESPNWKGNNVGKNGLHDWVKKHLGKPQKCEHCGKTDKKKYEWANKSQEYKRDLNDWIRLCTKCHSVYDKPVREKKWKLAVEKLGWKITKIK